jgi:uncharacterized membrane protein
MNSTRAFWGLFTLLTAVAAHLCYILFVPANQLQTKIDEVTSEGGINALTVATSGTAAAELAEYPAELAYAVCPFDLSAGPLRVKAQVPDQYWSLEIYNSRGGTIYTLNDQQAPRRQFSLFLSEDDPDPQAIINAANTLGKANNSITVLTGTQTGIVQIRSAAANPLEAARSMEALRNTSCEIVKS